MSIGAFTRITELPDRSEEYDARDLDTEGIWPHSTNARYGGVIFDGTGRVLLREPAGHFGRYVWTFAKGEPEPGESSTEAALREVLEETGCRPRIVGHLPAGFAGTSTGWVAYFYLMVEPTGLIDTDAVAASRETAAVTWANRDEAVLLIEKTPNADGRARDLRILDSAYCELTRLLADLTSSRRPS